MGTPQRLGVTVRPLVDLPGQRGSEIARNAMQRRYEQLLQDYAGCVPADQDRVLIRVLSDLIDRTRHPYRQGLLLHVMGRICDRVIG